MNDRESQKYEIDVIRNKCIGDGSCCDKAPYVFDMDDDAVAIIFTPFLKPTPDEKILAAAQACPVDAVVLKDKATGEQVWPETD